MARLNFDLDTSTYFSTKSSTGQLSVKKCSLATKYKFIPPENEMV